MAYVAPTAADLIERYPAFEAADDATVEYWLGEAATEIGETWGDPDRRNAQMAWAAHRLAELGAVPGISVMPGVRSFSSGTFQASMTDAAANATGFSATVYGRDYLALQRRNFAGPRVY